MCSFSSPDQMKSPFDVSPYSVHRSSEIPMISYLKRFISFLNSSSFPAAHRVCTFHVLTVRVFLASFSLSVFPVGCFVLEGLKGFPVVNLSILSWWLDRERGPCLLGRRPSRYGVVLWSFMVGFFRLVVFTDSGICDPSVKRFSFVWTCDRHRNHRIVASMVKCWCPMT